MSQIYLLNVCASTLAERMWSQDRKQTFKAGELKLYQASAHFFSAPAFIPCMTYLYILTFNVVVVTSVFMSVRGPAERAHVNLIRKVTSVFPLNVSNVSPRLNHVQPGTLQCGTSSYTELVRGQWNRQVHSLWFSSSNEHSNHQGKELCVCVCVCVSTFV